MPNGGIEALLFDLGGVVISIDFRHAFRLWARAAHVDARELAARFAFDEAYEAHERGEIGSAEYFESLRSRLRIDIPDEHFLEGWNAIFLDPLPGMRGMLRSLASALPLYLFSNTNPAHHCHWRRRYDDLLSPFSTLYCSHELGKRKPAVDAFLTVAARIGHAPDRIAFFDDLEENVAGADAAGMRAFRATSPTDIERALSRLGIKRQAPG